MSVFLTPGVTPGGSTTQVQFNDGGAFGGDADLTYDKTTNVLTNRGDINLDDGGSFTTTVQCVTPTANRTLSFPDATGTVALVAGSSGQVVWNNAGAYAGASTLTYDGSILTTSGRFINSYNATVASAPAKTFTGTWFTGGTATTTKPHVLIEPTDTTSTAWSTSGTGLGVNAASGFAGNLLDLQVNGSSRLRVDSNGSIFQNLQGATISTGLSYLTLGFNFYAIAADGVAACSFFGSVSGTLTRGVYVNASTPIGFSSGAASYSVAADTLLYRDAAGTLAQRNGTSAQTLRVYDTFASATDFHRVAIATARTTLSAVSGASVTATGLIPAGAVVMGVTSKVTTALGTANGTTGYQVGTAADPDRWGAITGTAAGTTSDNRNWTAGTIECFPAATNVIVTATGGNFNGTGVIYLSVQYMAGEAD
jgi:hypothetical protein